MRGVPLSADDLQRICWLAPYVGSRRIAKRLGCHRNAVTERLALMIAAGAELGIADVIPGHKKRRAPFGARQKYLLARQAMPNQKAPDPAQASAS